ncbi:helix-turn-helix transcriptional regulator [Sulfurimonas microaerophilic]|uniref:helix-turn-helix transcriptional regulator n=1 Tax=Sulfurimonas microaerophilic TaxID=3058392 RepID=UPI002714E8A9|nr:WYL domain-containing protein [Sulfurimonas sp. hsl 1-7]
MATSQHDKFFARSILLLQELSECGSKNISELAEMFGVNKRTIYRDIERLHFFPIELEKGKGIVRIAEGFALENPKLQDLELLVAELAFSSIRNIDHNTDRHLSSIRAKISNPMFFTPYDIKPESYEEINMDSELSNKIEDAITKRNVSKVKNNEQFSVVEPYKMVAFDGFWYLLAKDRADNKIKTYMLANMQDFHATTEVFDTTYTDVDKLLQNVHSAWFDDGNSFEVQVKIKPEVSQFFELKKHLSSQKVLKKYDDGSLLVSFEVSHDEDVDNLIKAWLPYIEIISPKRLRNKLVEELENYIAQIKE